MRTARTLFASAAVTAVIAVATPAAYAVTSADGWDKDSGSSSSSSRSDNDDREKPDSWKHHKPSGGVHTGGGALAGIMADGTEKDDSGSSTGDNADRDKPESWNGEKSSDHGKKSESWKHEKPSGGVHAGGGALAGITADGWEKDENGSSTGSDADREKPESWGQEESGESGEKSESWKHEKPTGGVHTGGGAMALSGSSLAAGSVLLLGGLGVGMYRLRRRNASGGAAV